MVRQAIQCKYKFLTGAIFLHAAEKSQLLMQSGTSCRILEHLLACSTLKLNAASDEEVPGNQRQMT